MHVTVGYTNKYPLLQFTVLYVRYVNVLGTTKKKMKSPNIGKTIHIC